MATVPVKKTAPAVKKAEPAPKAVQPAAPETPAAPEDKKVSDEGEQAIIDRIRSDDMILFRVPEDPFGEVKTWERSFNGHIICLKAGETRELPRFLVDFIEESLRITRESETSMAEYKTRMGKKLG